VARPDPRDALVAGLVLLLGRGRRLREREPERRLLPRPLPHPRAETVAVTLLFVSAACAIAFIVVYSQEQLPRLTQLLGLSLGLSLLALAAALIVAAKKLVVAEELEDEYEPEEHPEEQATVAQLVAEAGAGLTRKRLFKLGLVSAFGTLGLALITPALSFGPAFTIANFLGTPWRRGRRLVDENGKPYRASDIEPNDLYQAFAEGANKETQGASVVVVRLPERLLDLPRQLRGYSAGGIVAYSDICTHAGCAVKMYRAPLFPPNDPKPALVCPCHYSTFDPATGGDVLFGPAGRKLPMLPLSVDRRGFLRAKGNFDEPVGPSWWGVRMYKPNPH
jgi:ubiquinol-cytochrome c reductase iron-sulfur subunit